MDGETNTRLLSACGPVGHLCRSQRILVATEGFVARFRWGVPAMIGRIQSTMMPTPILAPLGTKPACVHDALI
jgi:hypothetical protein